MKSISYLMLTMFVALGCGEKEPAPVTAKGSGAAVHNGMVSQTMNSGGYTYVEIDEKGAKLWAAAQETAVKVGDKVTFSGMMMTNFESKSLKRKFERIVFAESLTVNGADKQNNKATAQVADVTKIADCFQNKDKLAGKPVKVSGKVVKYAAGIMGKNWLHLRDGSGSAGSDDLTITTNATASVGQSVTATGLLAVGKDFGAGYVYPVILEDALIE